MKACIYEEGTICRKTVKFGNEEYRPGTTECLQCAWDEIRRLRYLTNARNSHAESEPCSEEPKKEILYLCDRRACEKCSGMLCHHTNDIRHAEHFRADLNGVMYEEPIREDVTCPVD